MCSRAQLHRPLHSLRLLESVPVSPGGWKLATWPCQPWGVDFRPLALVCLGWTISYSAPMLKNSNCWMILIFGTREGFQWPLLVNKSVALLSRATPPASSPRLQTCSRTRQQRHTLRSCSPTCRRAVLQSQCSCTILVLPPPHMPPPWAGRPSKRLKRSAPGDNLYPSSQGCQAAGTTEYPQYLPPEEEAACKVTLAVSDRELERSGHGISVLSGSQFIRQAITSLENKHVTK